MSLGYETKPVGPKFQIQVVVNGKAKDHLARLARDAGCTTAMYAQRLFDAAFAARCGVSGDEELERAIGVTKVDMTAVAPSGAAPAPDAAAMAIATEVAARFGVSLDTIRGRSTDATVCAARAAAIREVFTRRPGMTNKQLGAVFARSHDRMSPILVKLGLARKGPRA